MRQLIRRLWYVVRQQQVEADLAEEMAFHRAMLARRSAKGEGGSGARAFGSTALAQNRARDVWIAPWLQDLGRDCRFALRLLASNRAFTFVIVGVLALGIGVANMQFVLLY